MKCLKLVLLMCFSFPLSTFGQTPEIDSSIVQKTGTHLLQTVRGDIFFGKTLNFEKDSIAFQVQGLSSPINFGRNELIWLGLAEQAGWLSSKLGPASKFGKRYNNEPQYWPENLAYSMTAFPYPKRGVEYRNISILYNIVDVGLSDNFSVGGGLVIPFLFIVRSKFAFELSEKFRLGAGMNNFLSILPDSDFFITHLFAIGTFGSPQQYFNITAGSARDWDFPEDSPLIVTLGGGISFAPNWKIYADIGISPGNEGIIPTIMLSWFKKKNRLEIGVLGVAEDFFSAIPMIGYAHRF